MFGFCFFFICCGDVKFLFAYEGVKCDPFTSDHMATPEEAHVFHSHLHQHIGPGFQIISTSACP